MPHSENKTIIKKIKNYWYKFWALVFFLGVSINFTEIVCRTVFNFSVELMYDLPVWLTIWSVMMLAGPILPDGEHVSVDMVRDRLSGTPKKILEAINIVICIIFGAVITYGGYLVTSQYYKFNMNIIRIVSVPRWLVESCIPIGMALFTVFAVIRFFNVIREKDTQKQENEY